jgi:esterase
VELHSFRTGSGPPLVILHGLFGSAENWRSHALAFADRFDVHVVDLRNHGRSLHDPDMSYDVMAADVGWYISSEGIAPCHLLGHSMGGKVAMWLALQHPALVDRLIVADIAPREHPPGHEHILAALCDLDPERLKSRKEAAKQISSRVPNRRVQQFLLKNLERNGEGGFRWRMNLPAIRANYDQIRGWPGTRSMRSDKQALFIAGTRSDYITIEDSDAIIEVFPLARFVDLDAGHWLHSERKDEFVAECVQFLLDGA